MKPRRSVKSRDNSTLFFTRNTAQVGYIVMAMARRRIDDRIVLKGETTEQISKDKLKCLQRSATLIVTCGLPIVLAAFIWFLIFAIYWALAVDLQQCHSHVDAHALIFPCQVTGGFLVAMGGRSRGYYALRFNLTYTGFNATTGNVTMEYGQASSHLCMYGLTTNNNQRYDTQKLGEQALETELQRLKEESKSAVHQCYTAGYLEMGAWVKATREWSRTGENTAIASYLGDGDGYDLGFVDPKFPHAVTTICSVVFSFSCMVFVLCGVICRGKQWGSEHPEQFPHAKDECGCWEDMGCCLCPLSVWLERRRRNKEMRTKSELVDSKAFSTV